MTDTSSAARATASARAPRSAPPPALAPPPAPAPAPERAHSRGGGPSGGLGALGLFTVLFSAALPPLDLFIVNVALDAIGRDLDTDPAVLELVVVGYAVSYACLLVLGGRLGDTFGRRRLLLTGLAAFGVTSLACGLAPNAASLIAARVAQGASAALLLPQALATIQAGTEGRRRARALAVYGANLGVAMVVGQIGGGLLVAADLGGTGWRAVFLVNVPAVLLALVLVWRTVPENRSDRPSPVDVPGTALLALSLVTLLVPLTEGRAAGWPPWSWISLAAFPLALAAFLATERRVERIGHVPLVPPSLLRLPGMRRALPMLALSVGGFSGFLFSVTIALLQGLHYGPVRTGAALTPYAVAFLVASLTGPRLAARFGSRLLVVAGLVQTLGLVVLALTVLSTWAGLDPWDLAPGMLLSGFGQGLLTPLLLRQVLADVPTARAGVGGGVMSTAQQAAAGVGVAVLGALLLTLIGRVGAGQALAATLGVHAASVLLTAALATRLPRSV